MLEDLTNLDGGNGFRISGASSGDSVGVSVSLAGDFNGDGRDDLIIGAPGADLNGLENSGSTYVLFGSDRPFPLDVDLSELNAQQVFRIDGAAADDRSGGSVSSAGDVNGDGIDDILIGASGADNSDVFQVVGSPGAGFVVFGSTQLGDSVNLSDLDGGNGFRVNGETISANVGSSGDGVRDINGDGVEDLIIGAPSASPDGVSGAGAAFAIFGSNGPFPVVISPDDLDGVFGFRINGLQEGAAFGRSVSAAGDVNGDGLADFIIGAPTVSGYEVPTGGSAFVIYGAREGFAASFDLASLNGENGFRIDGAKEQPRFGRPEEGIDDQADKKFGASVSGLGDFNGDGIDDFVVGAPQDTFANKTFGGSSFVVFGSASGFASSFSINDLDGENGFEVKGPSSFALSGTTVAGLGDVDGDGLSDLGVVSPDEQTLSIGDGGERIVTRTGASHVVFGSNDGFNFTPGRPGELSLASSNYGDNITIVGLTAGPLTSHTIAPAGDINGDGLMDFVIGEPSADPSGKENAGVSYVVFGTEAPNPNSPGVITIDENQRFVFDFNATDNRDAEGPGFTYGIANPDEERFEIDPVSGVLRFVTAPDFEQLRQTSEDFDFAVSITVTDSDNSVGEEEIRITINDVDSERARGDRSDNRLEGSLGSDTLRGGGGEDTLKGGRGGDLLFGNGGSDTLFGNGGKDTLKGGGARDVLEGNGGADILQGGGGNDSIAGQGGRDRLEGQGGRDFLSGDGGRDQLIGGRGNDSLRGGAGADQFIFGAKDGRDTIIDFRHRVDKIVIESGASDFSDLRIDQLDNNALIRFANTSIVLSVDPDESFSASDFIFT